MTSQSRASIDSGLSDEYLLRNVPQAQEVVQNPILEVDRPSTPQNTTDSRVCPGAPRKTRRILERTAVFIENGNSTRRLLCYL